MSRTDLEMRNGEIEGGAGVEARAPVEYGEEARSIKCFLPDDIGNRDVRYKKIGGFGALCEKLELGDKFKTAERIIKAFEKARVDVPAPSGKNVKRRPHLVIAGGFVRDILLGETPKDVDLATSMNYNDVRTLLSEEFKNEVEGGRISFITAGGNFSVLIVAVKDEEGQLSEQYEIATFRQDGDYKDGRRPESVSATRYAGIDADRRDLTINALFYNPLSGAVVDFVGGLDDIENRKLRFVGNPGKRIREDRLRMLRFLRFMRKTGFEADEDSFEAVKNNAVEIDDSAVERVKEELEKMFKLGKAGEALKLLEGARLLGEILPDVACLRDCPQGPPYHMEGDVLEHTMMVCNSLPEGASAALIWAAIFHDIAKPETRKETNEGGDASQIKVSFIGHEEKGAERLGAILKGLKFSGDEVSKIIWLVRNHIRAFTMDKMAKNKLITLINSGDVEELLLLTGADIAGSTPADEEVGLSNKRLIDSAKERVSKLKEELLKQPLEENKAIKICNGRTIIAIYTRLFSKNPEGIFIRSIKEKALERIVNDGVATEEEALKIMEEMVRGVQVSA